MKIDVLCVNDVFDTGLAAVLDAFATANELAVAQGLTSVSFDVTVVGLRRRVHSKQGCTVPVLPAVGRAPAEWVVVPAIGEKAPDPLLAAIARREAANLLRQWADDGAQVAAACIGTFLAAEAGVLDGKTATTTWWLAPLFRRRYPKVRLEDGRMLVRSDRVLTAGAALSHMDMALWLIRQASPSLAALTARYLIVDSRPTQSAYAMSDHLAHADPLVSASSAGRASALPKGFPLRRPRTPAGPASGRSHAASTTCSAKARSHTFKTCASSAPCICC